MFETAIRASDAMLKALRQGLHPLRPALMECTACSRVELIAAPRLGPCTACGATMVALTSERRIPAASSAPVQVAA